MKNSRTLALALVAISAGTSNAACTILNLSPNFELHTAIGASSSIEAVTAVWKNYLANGATAVGCTGIPTDLKVSLLSTSPHYKTLLDQLRFVKANGYSIDVTTNYSWDINWGITPEHIVSR